MIIIQEYNKKNKSFQCFSNAFALLDIKTWLSSLSTYNLNVTSNRIHWPISYWMIKSKYNSYTLYFTNYYRLLKEIVYDMYNILYSNIHRYLTLATRCTLTWSWAVRSARRSVWPAPGSRTTGSTSCRWAWGMPEEVLRPGGAGICRRRPSYRRFPSLLSGCRVVRPLSLTVEHMPRYRRPASPSPSVVRERSAYHTYVSSAVTRAATAARITPLVNPRSPRSRIMRRRTTSSPSGLRATLIDGRLASRDTRAPPRIGLISRDSHL